MNPITVRKIGPDRKNPKHIIYAGRRKAGLFSHVIEFLRVMAVADKLKIQPIVIPYWVNDSPYWSPSSYHGKTNVFEYYFEPINDYTIEDVLPIAPTKQDLSKIDKDFPGSSENTNKQIFLRYEVNGCPENVCIVAYRGAHFESNKRLEPDIHKYIKVRPFILKKVNEFKKKFMDGQKVIGVHIRGPNCYELRTPLRRLGYKYVRNNSLDNVPFKEYFALVDYQLREHPNSKILVATDDSRVLEKFKEHYKEKIIHYDAKRAVGGETHFIKGDSPLLKNESKAILGEEVLIEALLLSKADFFVHGKSNVSHAVKLWSPQMPRVDVFGRRQWPKDLTTKGTLSKLSKKPRPKIMITSDVKVCRAGHQQIHRDTAFMLSELFNLKYVHSPINIGGRGGKELSAQLDDLFGITKGATKISKVNETGLCEVHLRGHRFGKQYNSELEGLNFDYIKGEIEKCNDPKKRYLIFVPNGLFFSLEDLKKYVDGKDPKLFSPKDYMRVSNLLKRKFYGANKFRKSYFKKGVFNIAVHIRRGDIVNSERKDHRKYIPDKYFAEVIDSIVPLVKDKFYYAVHIYTEQNALLDPELENRPDTVVHRSKGPEGIIDDLYHLTTADILVQSKSFFSMVAAERSNGIKVLWDQPLDEQKILDYVNSSFPNVQNLILNVPTVNNMLKGQEEIISRKDKAIAKMESSLTKRKAIMHKRDKKIESLLNSNAYRLGSAILRPIQASLRLLGYSSNQKVDEVPSQTMQKGDRHRQKQMLPLLMSFPCSGSHWIRYCVEYFSGKRTPGRPLLVEKDKLNPNDLIITRTHNCNSHTTRPAKLILLLRNYKELFLRTSPPFSSYKMDFFEVYPEMVRYFHEYDGEKLLVYYEDLTSENFSCMEKVLSFLDIKYDLTKCDVNKLRKQSLKRRGSRSSKDGVPQRIHYSLRLPQIERTRIDNKFRKNLGDLYERYLGRYAESNLKY
ncbi:MAG: hypothetical protein QGI60_02310 [archaeon]|nr:hypothetical protein [archaeon]